MHCGKGTLMCTVNGNVTLLHVGCVPSFCLCPLLAVFLCLVLATDWYIPRCAFSCWLVAVNKNTVIKNRAVS